MKTDHHQQSAIPGRYRLPPTVATTTTTVNPMVALNHQFRGSNSGFLPNTSYPPLLDVLHEEEESSVASPATVQLSENQQQLEQLNLHQNYGGGGVGGGFADGSFLRCAPPSIVITGVGSRGQGGGGTGSGNGNSNGGAIALR